MVVKGGYVERCQECHGGLMVRPFNDEMYAKHAAREGRYLAEYITHISQAENIGHRPDCARKGRAR